MTLSKKLFYFLIFILPLNLGKHFITNKSYVDGILVDYLVPTIYIQDIFVFIILFIWFIEKVLLNNSLNNHKKFIFYKSVKNKPLKTLNKLQKLNFLDNNLYLIYFFIFSVFLSVVGSKDQLLSFLLFLRLLLYFLLFLYIYYNYNHKSDLFIVIRLFVFSFSLVSFLGILQFINKGSIFNNYLFFGEQPYSFSVPGITKENFFGFSVVPAYGLFRHPNIFGGLLSIILILNMVLLKVSKKYIFPFILNFLALIFTFSYTSFVSFIIGILLLLFFNTKESIFNSKHLLSLVKKKILMSFLYLIFLFSLLFVFIPINFFSTFFSNSYNQRVNLTLSTYKILDYYFSYGVGYGMYVKNLKNFLYNNSIEYLSFKQPVHNVFLLLVSESGVASLVFLILIIILIFSKIKNLILLIIFTQVVFLLMFDHYLYTIHQSSLFFWIIIGMCWTNITNNYYNKYDE